MVSVVIPTYNRAGFLEESIKSALNQDYPNIEVIVVDDGSTDATRAVCNRFGTSIRYLWKPNGGVSSALNLGIQRMRGEWFKALGSDDILEKQALSTFIRYAQENNGTWLLCNYVIIDEEGNQIRDSWPLKQLKGDSRLRALWTGREAGLSRKLGGAMSGCGFAHATLFDKVGLLNEDIRAGEDWEWALRASFIYGYNEVQVPLSLYKVRFHKGALTHAGTGSEKHRRNDVSPLEEAWRIRASLKSRLEKPGQALKPKISHYKWETKRLRAYWPFVLLAKASHGIPFYSAIRYWTWVVAPATLDGIYWAANPPVKG
jgi:glycosyltransferase involved in cell wall biosynthesis